MKRPTPDPIDLTNVLTPNWDDLGIRIELGWRLVLRPNVPGIWGATISKRRMTKGGTREGKPIHLVTLVGKEGGTPSDLLRELADVLEYAKPIEWTG